MSDEQIIWIIFLGGIGFIALSHLIACMIWPIPTTREIFMREYLRTLKTLKNREDNKNDH